MKSFFLTALVAAAATIASPVAKRSSSACPTVSSAIVYSPYQSSGGCKSSSQVLSDMQQLAAAGYSTLRIYGTDCSQVENCLAACASTGQNLFVGVFDVGSLQSELSIITSACATYGWDKIVTVSIGNELVNTGQQSASAMVSYTQQAKQTLQAAGYSGPVVCVDTFNAYLSNPALCQAGDYVAANAHAFFDGSTPASQAGAWVVAQQQALKSACGGMGVLITESGWPTQGNTIGSSVPSAANQKAAVASIKAATGGNFICYTAFNDLWMSSYDDQYWGVMS